MTSAAPIFPERMRIVIVGEGLAGAMAAAVLSRALSPDRYSISLVGSGASSSVANGTVEASLPSVRRFHGDLGLAEKQLIKVANASYSLGTGYAGWSKPQAAYFAPFGDVGTPLNGIAFHQLVQRLRDHGLPVRLSDYSVASLLAQNGRFTRPTDDDRSVLSTYSYALHLDSREYREGLLEIAASGLVAKVTSSYAGIDLADDGSIAAIVLDGRERMAADFVIDASGAGRGPRADLAGSKFESWNAWLLCDRMVEGLITTEESPPPYSLVEAYSWGWRRTVPALGVTGECVAYSSDGMSDDEAVSLLRGPASGTAQIRQIHAGRLKHPWMRNCVGIGEAGAMLDPSASTSLHLLQSSLGRLIKLFPTTRENGVESREYNRLAGQELDRTRDFVILRYKLNGRSGEPFWDQLRAMQVPGELAHKMEQYGKRGRVPLLDGDIFDESEWALLFDEHAWRPERYDTLADTIPMDQLRTQFERMRQVMNKAVAGVPYYRDYLAEIRASAAA